MSATRSGEATSLPVPRSTPTSSGPTSCPAEKAAVNQPKPLSSWSGGEKRATADCPAMVNTRCPMPSRALATATSATLGARASAPAPKARTRAPTTTMVRRSRTRSVIRPSHMAVTSGTTA